MLTAIFPAAFVVPGVACFTCGRFLDRRFGIDSSRATPLAYGLRRR